MPAKVLWLGVRLLRQYLWRAESVVSLVFLYLVWVYVRWLGGGVQRSQNAQLFGPSAKPLNAEITRYLTTPRPRKPRSDSVGLMTLKPVGQRWWCLRHNIAFYAAQGMRDGMEDRMSAYWDTGQEGEADVQVYAIFDGHGGQPVASYLESVFVRDLLGDIREGERALEAGSSRPNVAQLLHSRVAKADAAILGQAKGAADIVGSTLLAAVVYDRRWVSVANVGDSRAVYCDGRGKAHALTTDHKPDTPSEKKFIEAAGGSVQFFGVWRVNGILAMSRTMGDGSLKRAGVVTANADVATYDLGQRDWAFLILASDGLWDVVSAQEAVDAVLKAQADGKELLATDALSDLAINRMSMDNVSILVVLLPKPDPEGEAETS